MGEVELVFRFRCSQRIGTFAYALFMIASAAGATTTMAQNAQVPVDAKRITDPDELRAIFADRTIIGLYHLPDAPIERWSEYHCRNGRSRWIYESKLYEGNWWIKDGRACFAYREWEDGSTACFEVYADAPSDFKLVAQDYPELGFIISAKSLPGDPLKIQNLNGGSCEDVTS